MMYCSDCKFVCNQFCAINESFFLFQPELHITWLYRNDLIDVINTKICECYCRSAFFLPLALFCRKVSVKKK